jgi:gluconolactonase
VADTDSAEGDNTDSGSPTSMESSRAHPGTDAVAVDDSPTNDDASNDVVHEGGTSGEAGAGGSGLGSGDESLLDAAAADGDADDPGLDLPDSGLADAGAAQSEEDRRDASVKVSHASVPVSDDDEADAGLVTGSTIVAGYNCEPGATYGDPVPDDPQPVRVGDAVDFTEGPVWYEPDPVAAPGVGIFYFTDFTGSADQGRIRSYDPVTGELGVLIGRIGVNGLALDGLGRILGASHELRGVVRIDPEALSETLLPGSDSYMGSPFNSVNDLVARADGHVYFTDPTYQQGDRMGQDVRGYYHLSPAGEVTRIGQQDQPNGIAMSPDGQWLYVAGTGTPHPLLRHAINSDGSVDPDGEQISDAPSDGMVVDCAGNLYLTTGGGSGGNITILSSTGEQLGEVEGFSGGTTNATFGGEDHRTLFVTTSDAMWRVQMPNPGLPN